MTVRSVSPNAPPPLGNAGSFGAWIRRPAVLAGILIAYAAISAILTLTLDRGNLWYPLLNMCVFPAFVLSPLVILASPIAQRLKVSLMLILILIIMPIIGIINTSYLELAIQICIFSGLALGLNIVVGFAGLLDLGYVAFFAVGAYLWGVFTSTATTVFTVNGWIVPAWTFYIFIILALGAAALVGVLLGLPVLRVRGDYLAIVTLGFGEVIRKVAENSGDPVNITNGSQGLHNIGGPPLPGFAVSITQGLGGLLGVRMDNPEVTANLLLFYFISIVIVLLIVTAVRHLRDSAIGRAWYAIREDEVAAIAMGVPLVRMKLLAFATGASFGGAIGVLYAAKQTFIDPDSFLLVASISILAMVIVGGLGSIKGVLLGAAIVTLLDLHILTNLSLQINALRNADFVVPLINFHIRDWPTQLEPAKYQPFVFGLLLVLMMLFRPAGLLPEERLKMELQGDKGEGGETGDRGGIDDPTPTPPGVRPPLASGAAVGD